MIKEKIEKYVKSIESIRLYPETRSALKEVLLNLPEKDFLQVTKYAIWMVLHEGAGGQVIHFSRKNKFSVIQLTIPKVIPKSVLTYFIAHEISHVLQKRNWRQKDGMKLEIDAEEYANRIGFSRTKPIDKWIKQYRKKFGLNY